MAQLARFLRERILSVAPGDLTVCFSFMAAVSRISGCHQEVGGWKIRLTDDVQKTCLLQ